MIGRAERIHPAQRGARRRWRSGMAALLAWRNLTHDRARFAVTMVGIVFAVVLIAVELGLFFGFADSTTTIIRHARADLWIVAKGTRNFELAVPIRERELYVARSIPGVRHTEGLIVQFVPWKKPAGGDESVLIAGFDLNHGVIGPWHVVMGDREALRRPDAVIVDRLYAAKLGIVGLGDTAEINGHRARAVGLTQGIRSFTTSPWIFMPARMAQRIAGFDESQWNYVLVTLEPGADPVRVRDALRAVLPRADVYLTDELAALTRDYWMFTTGAGASRGCQSKLSCFCTCSSAKLQIRQPGNSASRAAKIQSRWRKAPAEKNSTTSRSP